VPAPSPLQLTAAFTPIDEHLAATLLEQTHGLAVSSIARLATERDDTFRVGTDRGTVVAKFAHPLDPADTIDEQLRVLVALERDHPTLPVSRVVPTRDGLRSAITADASGSARVLRVMTHLEGEALGAAPRTLDALRALGALHARLAAAIAAIGEASDPSIRGAATPWNLLALEQYGALAAGIADAGLRRDAERIVDRAHDAVLPRAAALPAVLAHNDLHGDNVLVHAEPFAVTGVLDFGDMTRTPRVADLAVAASYARGRVGEPGEPWAAARAYVSGFEAEQPLSEVEHALLPELVLLRLAQRGILNSSLAAANPRAAPYASRNLSAIGRDLRELGASIPHTIGARA
jgi:Ser/Thr protein kinase RdoA (MazF antagonist)